MASKKITAGAKKQKVENAKSSGSMPTLDEVPEKNVEYVHILLYNFYIIETKFSDMLVWFFSFSKITIPPLPSAATDEGFVKKPVGYNSFGKFKGSGGPKNLDKNLTPLEALRELLGDELPQRFSLVAKATSAEKGWKDDTSITAFWKYFTSVIGHGKIRRRTRCICRTKIINLWTIRKSVAFSITHLPPISTC